MCLHLMPVLRFPIQAYAVDSKGKRSPVVSVNYANGQGQLLNWSTVFPNGEDSYTLHFEALDKAGNKGSIAYPIAWDSVGAKSGENPEPVAVYDPKNPQASTLRLMVRPYQVLRLIRTE